MKDFQEFYEQTQARLERELEDLRVRIFNAYNPVVESPTEKTLKQKL